MAKYLSVTDFRVSVQTRTEGDQTTRFTRGHGGMEGAVIGCSTSKEAIQTAARLCRFYDEVRADGKDVKIFHRLG